MCTNSPIVTKWCLQCALIHIYLTKWCLQCALIHIYSTKWCLQCAFTYTCQ